MNPSIMGDDWTLDCSDEEFQSCRGEWEPATEDINNLYDIICKGDLPELKWKCPGYRAPSPELKEMVEEKVEDKMEQDKSDFDFQEDLMTPKLKSRKDGEEVLKGSAKKKTTSLDGVLSNMRRHNIIPAKAPDVPT